MDLAPGALVKAAAEAAVARSIAVVFMVEKLILDLMVNKNYTVSRH